MSDLKRIDVLKTKGFKYSDKWFLVDVNKKLYDKKYKKVVVVEGLPGIGNVGKMTVDFLIDELKAEKICDIFSYSMPASVFVNEDNLIELPKISFYYKKVEKNDFIFISGDLQPSYEEASYEACDFILDLLKKFLDGNIKDSLIITTGGIGVSYVTRRSKVYLTGNSKKVVDSIAKKVPKIKSDIYGVVGPVMGITGLLLGIGKLKGFSAVSFLAETFAHPMYLGVSSVREIVRMINAYFDLTISTSKLDKEVRKINKQLQKSGILQAQSRSNKKEANVNVNKTNYIG